MLPGRHPSSRTGRSWRTAARSVARSAARRPSSRTGRSWRTGRGLVARHPSRRTGRRWGTEDARKRASNSQSEHIIANVRDGEASPPKFLPEQQLPNAPRQQETRPHAEVNLRLLLGCTDCALAAGTFIDTLELNQRFSNERLNAI